jgi:competence protein ComEC
MRHFKHNLKIYLPLFLLVLNIIIFYSIYYISSAELKVAFLDVGQGDAIFIKSPSGRQMLIDGGPNNKVLRELGKVMPFYDRSIDVVLATHADQDHIGGLVEVLKRFKVDLFIRSNSTSTSDVYIELENLIKKKDVEEVVIFSPQILTLGKNTEFDIIFPTQNTASWETNDASVVGKLIYGNNSFLLTGDSPQIIEKYLVGKYGSFLKSDILKVGHHGSKNSSSELFVGTVSPKYSVISVGKDNRYGHPNPEALNVLKNFGGQILETMTKGRIIFKLDGTTVKLIEGN